MRIRECLCEDGHAHALAFIHFNGVLELSAVFVVCVYVCVCLSQREHARTYGQCIFFRLDLSRTCMFICTGFECN